MLHPTSPRFSHCPSRSSALHISPRPRLLAPQPLDLEPGVQAILLKLGRDCSARPGEDLSAFERRLQTDLMTAFQKTRSHGVFNALHRRTSPVLRTWIKGLLQRRAVSADPHELVQDTFVNIYSYASSFKEDNGNTFMPWARTIAANVMRRSLRRGRLVPLGESDLYVDQRSGPNRRAQCAEELEQARRAWPLFLTLYMVAYRSLGARDQRALHLAEVEGKSYEQLADALGVGRKNVKMIMFRARKRLQDKMRCQLALGRAGEVRRVG